MRTAVFFVGRKIAREDDDAECGRQEKRRIVNAFAKRPVLKGSSRLRVAQAGPLENGEQRSTDMGLSLDEASIPIRQKPIGFDTNEFEFHFGLAGTRFFFEIASPTMARVHVAAPPKVPTKSGTLPATPELGDNRRPRFLCACKTDVMTFEADRCYNAIPMPSLTHPAPFPATGSYAEGFHPVAFQFAKHLQNGDEIGASLAVYHRGTLVVDLAGGFADTETGRPFQHNTRIVVFSVTKGFAAMALNLLADRGLLEWDAPVSTYWPEFAKHEKSRITLRSVFSHNAGLAALDTALTLDDCLHHPERVRRALEEQTPQSPAAQAYHAITFGMLAREVFERVASESMGAFLRRELFEPLGSDVHLGTPAALDPLFATLYPPSPRTRIQNGLFAALFNPKSTDGRLARSVLARESLARRAFQYPSMGPRGILALNDIPIRRSELAWVSATASANGVARAYLPFALGGAFEGRRYLQDETLHHLSTRDGWSDRDGVLQKPLGWNRGFLKEDDNVFGPNREGFGHAGMGGALGWCDPKAQITIGYVMNRMDWRIRSPRALALTKTLYSSPALR